MGDKTQLVVFSLSMRYGWRAVFAGSVLGFAIINGPIAFLGVSSARLFPQGLVMELSALLFLIFGVYLLLRKDICEVGRMEGRPGRGFFTAFGSIIAAELGDKTQLATFILASRFGDLLAVYGGVIAGLSVSVLVGIFLGRKVCDLLPPKLLSYLSASLFLILGIYTLMEV